MNLMGLRLYNKGSKLTTKALICISANQENKGVFQFEIIINVLVSSFPFGEASQGDGKAFYRQRDALRGYRETINGEVEALNGYGDAREGYGEALQGDGKHYWVAERH